MVMMERVPTMAHPRKAQTEPEKLSPSGRPFDARLAMNHRKNSQYRAISASKDRIPKPRTPIRETTTTSATVPKNQGTTVIAAPSKLRFGRPGPCTCGTSHLRYHTSSHGNGIRKAEPIANTIVRQVKSQIPKSIDSAPPPYAP